MSCNSFPFSGSNCGNGCNNGFSACTWTLIIIAIVFLWIFCGNGSSYGCGCNDCGCN